jgi:hypothetical protein
MQGTTTLVVGILVVTLVGSTNLRAQELELSAVSAPAAKIKLKDVAAQVAALQNQIDSLNSTISSLQSTVGSLNSTLGSLQSKVADLAPNFAVLEPDARLARGHNVLQTGRRAVGRYLVNFKRNVTDCVYLATLGSTDGGTVPPGTISVAHSDEVSSGIEVETTDTLGTDVDSPFHLAVFCP